MHDVVVFSLLHGGVDSPRPWSRRAGRQVPVPVARLRPALRDHRDHRHRDDPRADERGRPRRRPHRGTRRDRPRDQGHVVRAGVLQPDRRHVLLGERPSARPDENGRNGFPAVLGQRLRGAHPDARLPAPGRRAGPGGHGGQPQPAVRVRVDVEDHLRRRGRQLLRWLAGQHRLVPAVRRQEDHRPGQGQPVAAPAVLRRRRRCAPADAAPSAVAGAQVRAGRRDSRGPVGRLQGGVVDRPQGRLLRQPRRAARHGQAHGRAGQGRRHRGDRSGCGLPVPKRPGGQEHSHRAHFPSTDDLRAAIDGLATCTLLAATESMLED